MEKLLVTGGCGFIGSNFVRNFLKKNPEIKIVNLDKLTYCGRKENLSDIEADKELAKRYEFIKGDICNQKIVKKAMKGCKAIVHFAAETHVDRSINDPMQFLKTDVIGTATLLEEARKQNIEKFVHISCYDEKTRALTTAGLKRFDELKKGDIVFSLNQKTQQIETKPIEKIIIQNYKGKMIHFKNKRADILVTPNHRMFILNTKKRLLVEDAEKVRSRGYFYMPNGIWKGINTDFYDFNSNKKVKTKDVLYLLGIFIGDGFTAYQEKEMHTKSGLDRSDFLKDARCKDTGRFITINKKSDYKSICHSYRIFFDIPEKDKCRKKVEKTLKRLGINYCRHSGKSGTHLYFSSKEWMAFFDQCGQGAHNKQIPRWALEYSPKYLKYLFNGLMDSDGHAQKIFHTVSKKLVYGMVELCTKLDLRMSVLHKYHESKIGKRKISGKIYCLSVAKSLKSISREKSMAVNYSGKIWCLRVKDNKNFLIERNGKFDFCGNTDEVYGHILEGSFTEESVLNPRNPYSASKCGADRLVHSYFSTYDVPIIIIRPSNNFGPYQYPEKVIPLFVTNLMNGKKVPLYGDGKNVRDWLFVLDNCEAIGLCLKKGKIGEVYNVAGGNELSNIELTKLILKEFGKGEEMINFVQDRLGHDRRYSMKADKIKKELCWKPQHKFENALHETIEWYKNNEKWWKPLIK